MLEQDWLCNGAIRATLRSLPHAQQDGLQNRYLNHASPIVHAPAYTFTWVKGNTLAAVGTAAAPLTRRFKTTSVLGAVPDHLRPVAHLIVTMHHQRRPAGSVRGGESRLFRRSAPALLLVAIFNDQASPPVKLAFATTPPMPSRDSVAAYRAYGRKADAIHP